MSLPPPVLPAHLFPELNHELLKLLDSLSTDEWSLPTSCSGWSVKDIAAHLLDVDLGILSRERDGFDTGLIQAQTWAELVEGLNRKNEAWVAAMRGLSPAVLRRLLATSSGEATEYLGRLDPFAENGIVAWAGPGPAPIWLHTAREYTERWHHQQQIREASDRPLLTRDRLFAPVIPTFVRALPRTYAGTPASPGTTVRFKVTGPGESDWFVVRESGGWMLAGEVEDEAQAEIIIDGLDAWRLFTRSLADPWTRVTVRGEAHLAMPAMSAVAIIA